MSEPQQSTKKNKKKKKQSVNVNGTSTTEVRLENKKKAETVQKLDSVIKEVLPQKIGLATKIKDVEVTMTKNGNNEAVNGTSTKKKKKKKKSKQQSTESAGGETLVNDTENQNLLHFSENHIELVNHPEISVTISTAPVVQTKESPKPPQDKIDAAPGKKGPPQDKIDAAPVKKAPTQNKINAAPTKTDPPPKVAEPPPTSSKKKKKKKKKKNTENGATPDAPPSTDEPIEDAHSTPTYVKLPADGGNCVLLVSHESFSNGSKQPPPDNTKADSQNKTATVLIKKKEIKEVNNNPSNSNMQNNSSVSIFPVYSDPNKKLENNPEFNVSSSLGKISNMIKNDNSPSESGTIPNEAEPLPVANTEETKTKAQLKAERRAIQEAQRAAKLAKTGEKDTTMNEQNKKSVNTKEPIAPKQNQVSNGNPSIKDAVKVSIERENPRKVQIFSHLSHSFAKQIPSTKFKIPPPILELGTHYSNGTLCGSNARCVGFLAALRQVIIDYRSQDGKVFLKDLESKLQNYLEFLGKCRPLSVSIVNAMKFLKRQIHHIPIDTNEDKAKESLCQSINDYVREEILLAKEAITTSASAKILNDDTVLVFAYSSLVKGVLFKAHDEKKYFRVIVVDSRAKLEGLQMLRQLVKHGIRCSYISINAVSSVIKKVNKVIIGAHALLANGYVMSRLGCKIVSLVGSSSSVPVLVCCETYKFWERSLTDSIVHNELGNPDDLVTMSLNKKDSLLKWHNLSSLQIYNLLYDVTPSELISVVITEKGLIPCTSVPVLLRVKHAGRQE